MNYVSSGTIPHKQSDKKAPLAEIAQLGERQSEDLKVPGSMPESLIEL